MPRRSTRGKKLAESLISSEPLDVHERDAISTFFAGRSIFITGATGFLGKVLIEKVLRSTPDVGTIYVLVREKRRGKEVWSAQRRLDEELLNSRVFARVKQAHPDFARKIVGIPGDLQSDRLGISDENFEKIVSEVSVVLHMAATVNFTAPMKQAHALNIEGMRKVMELAKAIHATGNLASVVHTSTCYVNSLHFHLPEAPALCREELVQWEHDYRKFESDVAAIVDAADEAKKTPGMLEKYGRPETGAWPNTYTITKRIAEEVLRVEFADADESFPISVVRPSIIGPAIYEPMPGWGDAMSCVAGPLVGAWLGVLHAFPCDHNLIFDFVPVDLVSNAILVSAWHRYAADEEKHKPLMTSDEAAEVAVWGAGPHEESRIPRPLIADKGKMDVSLSVPVVQVCSSMANPTTWEVLIFICSLRSMSRWRSSNAIGPAYMYLLPKDWTWKFFDFIFHIAPALTMDFIMYGVQVLKCKGFACKWKAMKGKEKAIDGQIDVLDYFTGHQWKFESSRCEVMLNDVKATHRETFNCTVNTINWCVARVSSLSLALALLLTLPPPPLTSPHCRDSYIVTVGQGVKTFLLNEWICRWEAPGGDINAPESRGERTVKQLNGNKPLAKPIDPSGFIKATQSFERDSFGMGPGPKLARMLLLAFVAVGAAIYYIYGDLRTALEIAVLCYTIHMLI